MKRTYLPICEEQYVTPAIEILDLVVEGGFVLSEGDGEPDDIGDGSITDDSDSWS